MDPLQTPVASLTLHLDPPGPNLLDQDGLNGLLNKTRLIVFKLPLFVLELGWNISKDTVVFGQKMHFNVNGHNMFFKEDMQQKTKNKKGLLFMTI